MKITSKIGILFFLLSINVQSQDIVDVNLNIKHVVGGVSKFDREKYILLHASLDDKEWPSEAYKQSFLEDYDVYLGRNNGSLPWIYSNLREDPNKAGWPDISYIQSEGQKAINKYKSNTTAHKYENRLAHYMIGGQEVMYTNYQNIGPNNSKWFMAKDGYKPLAEYYANYFKYFFGNGGTTGQPQPTYVEIMNEPFVKSTRLNTTNENLSEMHRVVTKRIKELNPNIKVGGYSAAHPAHEGNNFKHWDKNWKTFIDIAGEEMDFFSLHLYDNVQKIPEEGQYRAGSNIEAILDMIEHYEFIKLGKIKPFCISEYGCLNTEGEPFTKERDWNNLRSFNTMIMQLLERPNVMDQALPFMILQANWWNHPTDPNIKYAHRLFRQKKELAGETGDEFVYTELIKFYQFWQHVKGTRIDTKASNLDTQIDAYVYQNKAYVIINNLHHEARTVDLSLKGLGDANIQSILVKHLHAENTGVPALDEYTINESINTLNIGREASILLEYTLDRNINPNETSNEAKYYATTYNQNITANNSIDFNINNVDVNATFGEATLRLGIGRDLGKSLKPTLSINGTTVSVPENWRGNEQNGRDDFFGVLEINVPYNLLQQNNTVSVTFPDTGGRVSSLAMQVQSFESEITRSLEKGIQISNNNFTISTQAETCENRNNGLIVINANKEINYTVSLNNTNIKNFKQTVTLDNLAPNTYDVKITSIDVPNFEQKYQVTIAEAQKLSLISSVNNRNKTVTYYLSGSDTYDIVYNNNHFKTSSSIVNLPLNNGNNNISVSSEKTCQGNVEATLYYEPQILVSPNPFKDILNINLGMDKSKTVNIAIYNLTGAQVYHKTEEISNSMIELQTSDLTQGIYMLSVTTQETKKNFKIYKQ